MLQKDIPLVEENSLRVNNSFLNQGQREFLVQSFGQNSTTVLAVTHQPNIEDLCKQLIGREISPPTAGMVVLEQTAQSWTEFTAPTFKAVLR